MRKWAFFRGINGVLGMKKPRCRGEGQRGQLIIAYYSVVILFIREGLEFQRVVGMFRIPQDLEPVVVQPNGVTVGHPPVEAIIGIDVFDQFGVDPDVDAVFTVAVDAG